MIFWFPVSEARFCEVCFYPWFLTVSGSLAAVYDMYNHRNGEYLNTALTIYRDESHELRAAKNIKAGDQIHNSYNMCDECEGRAEGYGTPDIFRDYGFVENYPQRWMFENPSLQVDLVEDAATGEISLEWHHKFNPQKYSKQEERIVQFQSYLRQQIKRLNKIRHVFTQANEGDDIPEHELGLIWRYHEAVINAYTIIFEDLSNQQCDFCIDPYDDLTGEEDTNEIVDESIPCESESTPGYEVIEMIQTNYQNMFFESLDGDVCLHLDATLQACSSYRPFYHELTVHTAASFLETVRRVAIIGGGDSMMLHETLKYTTLEKVVLLELDQDVVRASFEYFKTQPHFDDGRVEWWFGSALKSIHMLPTDYFGSFDLVVLDLSDKLRNVAGESREDAFFRTLVELLGPSGVLVSMESFVNQMASVFNYTARLQFACPTICRAQITLGSGHVNFLEHNSNNRTIQGHVHRAHDPLLLIDHFEHTLATSDGMEGIIPPMETVDGGILLIVDAEEVQTSLADFQKIVTSAVSDSGYRLIEEPKSDQDSYVVAMEEGYVSVRFFEEDMYCMLDVHLWGKTHLQDRLQKALVAGLKSKITSSFRIVVGGMKGKSSKDEEMESKGPPSYTPRRNSNPELTSTTKEGFPMVPLVEALISTFHQETQNMAVGVVCGAPGSSCSAFDSLTRKFNALRAIPIWTCPERSAADRTIAKVAAMYQCEQSVNEEVTEAVKREGKLSILLFDTSSEYTMGRIFDMLLSNSQNRKDWFEKVHTLVAVNAKEEALWRQHLLTKYHDANPLPKATVHLQSDNDLFSVNIITIGQLALPKLHQLEKELANGAPELQYRVRKITGGTSIDTPPALSKFVQDSYDNEKANLQFKEQSPKGRQSVFQMTAKDKAMRIPSVAHLEKGLRDAIKKGGFQGAEELQSFDSVGEGILIWSKFLQGHASVVWDGDRHVDLSVFLEEGTQEDIEEFQKNFSLYSGWVLKTVLQDDFPRGAGRVVTLENDS